MSAINLPNIISNYGLDEKSLAALLFPDNKHPKLAFNRAKDGKTALHAGQLKRLADFIGIPVDALYNQWKHVPSDKTHKFENGDYIAILDLKSGVTKIFLKGGLKHESVLHSGALTLTEYFGKLDSIIKKFKT